MSTVTDARLQAIRLTNTIMRCCFNAGILAQAKATTSRPIPFVTSNSDPTHPFHEHMEACAINELRSLLFEHIAVLAQGTSTLLDLASKVPPSDPPAPSRPEGETRAHTPGPSGTIPPFSET